MRTDVNSATNQSEREVNTRNRDQARENVLGRIFGNVSFPAFL